MPIGFPGVNGEGAINCSSVLSPRLPAYRSGEVSPKSKFVIDLCT